MENLQFQVRKKQFVDSRLTENSASELALDEGDILVKIDKFAYTANNITYAVTGDTIGYWNFYPVSDGTEQWGMIPVWGFAHVVQSKCNSVSVGDRFFGYFPPAIHLKMHPVRVDEQRFVAGSPHRVKLPAVYNVYHKVTTELNNQQTLENQRMVLFPLHLTAYFLGDRLQEKQFYGAEQVLILSASSKTGTGLGYALRELAESPHIVGLTSPRNLESVAQLKLYDSCLSYAEIAQIKSVPTVIVDMSGSGKILKEIHVHLGDQLKYILKVGLTHWTDTSSSADIEDLTERSRFFFAPTQIARRMQEWGPNEYQRRTEGFMKKAADRTGEWMDFRKIEGLQGLMDIHPRVCKGEIPTNQGLVVEM